MIINEKLSCGVDVVMEQIPYVRSTSVGVWVKAGSVNENQSNYGISHFIEHMMFKGTASRSAKQIAEEIDMLGGQINAFTGKESTCYYVKTLDENIEKAVAVLFDILFHSVFDQEEMEKEKQVVYEEINMHDDTPEDDIHDVFYEAAFKDHPLGTPILGTKEHLASFTREDLKAYVADNYTTGNVVISVAGNFQRQRMMEVMEASFQELSVRRQRPVQYAGEYKPSFLFKEKDIEQSHICMGVRGITLYDQLHYAYAVVSSILGGSMSSRLFQSIREERGLAYSVYSYLSAYTSDGTFSIYAGVGQDKLEETIDVIRKELALLKEKGITREEFQGAKEQLKSSYIFSMESVSGRMASNGKSQLLLGRVYTPEESLRQISDVSMEEIQRVIEAFTDIDRFSAGALGRNPVDLKDWIHG